MPNVKTAKEKEVFSPFSPKAVLSDETERTSDAEQSSMSHDCSYLSPSWNVVEKIADYIHAVGRVNGNSGSAVLIGYTHRYDFDANECEEEWEEEATNCKGQQLYKKNVRDQEITNRQDCGSTSSHVKENNGNKSSKSKTRFMGVLLTTSSVLFPEDYANDMLPTAVKKIDTSNQETITFLEEPVAGTAARLGFTTAPLSVRLRTDCGLITSLTDDELRREERRRRDQFNHINFKNEYCSELEETSSTVSSDDSTISSNEETPSSQLSPLFGLSKSNNEVDGQLNSEILISFVSSHLHKTGSNGHISNSGKHPTAGNDKEKDHPLVILNEESSQTHTVDNNNNAEVTNKNVRNITGDDKHNNKSRRKDERNNTTVYIPSDDMTKNESNTCIMTENSYLTSTSHYDTNDSNSNTDISTSNSKDLATTINDTNNNNNKENYFTNSSNNASHVLYTTHNTALPQTSTIHSHNSINIKSNFTSSYHCHNDNLCSNNSDNNAEEVFEDNDETNGEIVGYCLTYCDLTPTSLAPRANTTTRKEDNDNCSSWNADTLTEEQVCSAITPLPLPLLLSKLRPVEVGDVHMIITYVDEYRRNNNMYTTNNDSITSDKEECLNNKERQYNATFTSTTSPPPPPLQSKVTRRHKLYKVCFVSEHYCEYELTCSTDHLHWCSGGAVFDGNGSFIGLHHQEVEGRCMCLFTSSIVQHLFANNLLGLCNSPISSLTRMQVANGEVESSSSSCSEDEEEHCHNNKSYENNDSNSAMNNRYINKEYEHNMNEKDKLLEEQVQTEHQKRLIRQHRRRLLNASNNHCQYSTNKNCIINKNSNAEISLNDAFMMCSNNGKQLVDFTTFQRMRAHHRCVTSALPSSFEEVYDEFFETFHSIPHLLYAFPYCPPLVIKVLDELVKPIHNTEANMEYIALNGGIGVILELIDAYSHHTALLTSALIALAKLIVHDRCLNIFTQLDGIITLLALLRDHNESYRREWKRTLQFTQWAVFCLLKACSAHAAHVESSKALIASENNMQILCTLLATCTEHISPRVEQMLTWLCALLHELTDCDSTICMSLLSLNTFSYLSILLSYCHENMKYVSEVLLLNILSLLDILSQQLLHIRNKQTEENVEVILDSVEQQKMNYINYMKSINEVDAEKKENNWSVTFISHIIAIADKYTQTKYTTYKYQILTHCVSLLSALCIADHTHLTFEAVNQIEAICDRCISSSLSSVTMYSHMNVLAQELKSKLLTYKYVN